MLINEAIIWTILVDILPHPNPYPQNHCYYYDQCFCVHRHSVFIGDKEINQNHSLQRLKLIRGLPFSAHHLNNLGWHLAWWHHIHQYHHYLNHHQNLCKDVVVIVISSPPLDFVVDRYIVNTPWLLAPCLTSTRCWWWGGGMRRDNIYVQPQKVLQERCAAIFLTKS